MCANSCGLDIDVTPVPSRRAVREKVFCSADCLHSYLHGKEPIKPSDLQVSGAHYKSMAIQPAEYNTKNKLGFLEGNAIKYVSRHGSKNGVDDLRKAIHCLELLIEWTYDGE